MKTTEIDIDRSDQPTVAAVLALVADVKDGLDTGTVTDLPARDFGAHGDDDTSAFVACGMGRDE